MRRFLAHPVRYSFPGVAVMTLFDLVLVPHWLVVLYAAVILVAVSWLQFVPLLVPALREESSRA